MPNTNLFPLLSEIDCLRLELKLGKLADLRFYCDGWVHPDQLDEDGLELLLERLLVRWADAS